MNDIKFLQNVNIYGGLTALSAAHIPKVIGSADKLVLIPDIGYVNDAQIVIEPSLSGINIRSGEVKDASTQDLILGGDLNHIKISDVNNKITFKTTDDSSNTFEWIIDEYGVLNLPLSSDIKLSDGSSIITDPKPITLNVSNSASFGGNVAIGSVETLSGAKFSVIGNVVIDGTITATGSAEFVNTVFTTTSSLSISNVGTGPALVVNQEGENAVAAFYDEESSVALWVDGRSSAPGFVGVKTSEPNKELTVVGDISATGIIYGSNIINKFTFIFGDGINTSYTIPHTLLNDELVVTVIERDTKEVVYPAVTYTTLSSVTVEFSEAPTLSAYKIILIG